jgi:triacylglycerol lipase
MSVFVELPEQDYRADAFDDFSPAAAFQIGTARALMWASQLAYETHVKDKVEVIAGRWRFDAARPFSRTVDTLGTAVDTRGFIGERAGVRIVAFAGTDPAVLQNLITDFDALPQPGTDIHGGFNKALDAVWDIVAAAVAQPVVFAGHSLGAALAVLAAQRAIATAHTPVAVYTFGLPRVGGRQFAAGYDRKIGSVTYRLVHGNDIVPTVPPSGLGFRHVGRLLQCASGGKFADASMMPVGSDKPGFNASLGQGLWHEAQKFWRGASELPGPGPIGSLFALLPGQIRDHLPDRYIAALRA